MKTLQANFVLYKPMNEYALTVMIACMLFFAPINGIIFIVALSTVVDTWACGVLTLKVKVSQAKP